MPPTPEPPTLIAGERALQLGRLDGQQLEDSPVRLAAGDHGAQDSHEGEAGNAAGIGDRLPGAGLVDEGLADVENHGLDHRRDVNVPTPALRAGPPH